MGAEGLPIHGLTSPRPATRSATTLEGGRSRLELGLLGEPVFEHVAREADMPPDAEAGQATCSPNADRNFSVAGQFESRSLRRRVRSP